MSIVRIPPSTGDADLELIRLSRTNPGYRVEREGDGTITMRPTGGFGGAKSLQAALQLALFAQRVGGKAFDSNQGWKLKDRDGNDVDRSPDASWLSDETVERVPLADRTSSRILRVVPDVAIEVKSPSDSWKGTIAKLDLYEFNGSAYAVAIDPETREVVERGKPPTGLHLDFDAIIDA
jgi:Uma2 family endonuclease